MKNYTMYIAVQDNRGCTLHTELREFSFDETVIYRELAKKIIQENHLPQSTPKVVTFWTWHQDKKEPGMKIAQEGYIF